MSRLPVGRTSLLGLLAPLLLACAQHPAELTQAEEASVPAGPEKPAGPALGIRGPFAVERVVDGDTLLLSSGQRVRLLGIDTPELSSKNQHARTLARAAQVELRRLVSDGPVTLVCLGKDKYDRTLAYVHASGTSPGDELSSVNRSLLLDGHARLYPTEHPRQAIHAAAQREAKRANRGIWTPAGRRATGWGLPAEADVRPEEARLYEGRRVRIVGTVDHTHRSAKALFVNFSKDWKTGFTAVIFSSHLGRFPADIGDTWTGKRLAVTGIVKMYKGAPEIVVESADQVELLD